MSVIAAALRELMAAGLTGEALVQAVERIEAAAESSPPPGAEMTKSARAERNRRYYAAKQERLKASENRLTASETHKTSEASEGVLKRLKASEIQTPLARVENNPLRLVDTGNTTQQNASECADACWPECDPPSRADLDRLGAALREAAGDAVDLTAPAILNFAPILALSRNGAGPACDLQADVLPAIRGRAARARAGSVRSWSFFTGAITDARDQRLAGAPKVVPIDATQQPRGPPTYWQEQDRLARQSREVAERLKAEYAAK